MLYNSRPLTQLEQETWDTYACALTQIPNAAAYDRVSIHNAFPDLKAAFERCRALETYNKLTNTGNNER